MPANKNALIRYKTIDNCLRNRYRRWTLDDLVEACSDALYYMEGITKGVCARTVQMDIQIMRSDKLGYNAPIEVYDRIYSDRIVRISVSVVYSIINLYRSIVAQFVRSHNLYIHLNSSGAYSFGDSLHVVESIATCLHEIIESPSSVSVS